MTDTFHSRLLGLSDADLRTYLEQPLHYRTEVVEAALLELARRGLAPAPEDLARIRHDLAQRDAAAHANLDQTFVTRLGSDPATRLRRVRQITLGILATGLGAATIVYLRTMPKGANPLGYEPEDTKKYLRDLELYGGKVNVLATEFTRWWEGLWQGRNLAYTLAWLTFFAALGFWLVARRRALADLRATTTKD
ncbi:hypothetical protein GETHLI_33750 [Geothrix limicola]|uniref:DUF1707 domain-containing protein n=1 Tax=Geothrix limicola TaxID=2927978 RepID=A0ABQ5QJK6_9BACT|nr:hypothetical protein [Geothrix limicola]GLH74873.1 hypothetical protein GETHLI_33750 [Geothrix limicola]